MTGFDGPITIARAPRSPRRRSGGPRLSGAVEAHVLDRPLSGAADEELLQGPPSARGAHVRADGVVAHREHPTAPRPSRRRAQRASRSGGRPAGAARAGGGADPSARSRSPRLNQTSTPSSRRPSMTANVSPSQAPAALVDPVGQPVGDEVGVGRDVRAVDLDVVAGVGDHDQVVARPRRASRARAWRRRSRRRGRRPAGLGGPQLVRQAGELDAGVRLVAHVDRDQQRRSAAR